MSGSIAIWLIWAVVLFWAVGAYNRLMRLRAAVVDAFADLDEQLRLYGALVQTGLAALDGEAAPVLPRLLGAAQQFDAALKAARLRPLDALTLRVLATAHETLLRAWSDACSEPPDLAGQPLPEAMQQQWQHISLNAVNARARFAQSVVSYNEGITGFPARLLARLFGFKPAQPL